MEVNLVQAGAVHSSLTLGQSGKDGNAVSLYTERKGAVLDQGNDLPEPAMVLMGGVKSFALGVLVRMRMVIFLSGMAVMVVFVFWDLASVLMQVVMSVLMGQLYLYVAGSQHSFMDLLDFQMVFVI
ncbi:MAG: hypothetical protein Q9M13_07525 [Mariprofundales bacterium]|nr:hypothetical protein [Mariprofundales bacterium]